MPLHRIGAGSCGSVWTERFVRPGSVVIKREDGREDRSLKNDSDMHLRILLAYESGVSHQFAIPLWYGYIPAHNAKEVLGRFPWGYAARNILLTERILPLSLPARRLLLNRYCPPALLCSTVTNNHDCLVRPYLGSRRERVEDLIRPNFTLVNLPLYLDQMEELKMKIPVYSLRMARALAFMHWSARVDAEGVKFGLAAARDPRSTIKSSILDSHCIWMFDFDRCKPMTMDTVGIKQAAGAFWRNDPCYPRPGKNRRKDINLWKDFKRSYLKESFHIIGSGDVQRCVLPGRLIRMIENMPPDRNGHSKSCCPFIPGRFLR
ncbi:zinc finger protein-domain-containing protein [Hypoxylon argillaceum]|nr:zinc finger protein-domain-containing protein [Hypoxylon argillaceum]